MSERMATLRELLNGRPNKTRWMQIVDLFASWPPKEELSVALDYAQAHLQKWPKHLQTLEELNTAHPAWPLVKSINWALSSSELQECAAALQNITELRVTDLDDTSVLAPLSQLLSLRIDMGHYEEIEGLRGMANLQILQIGEPAHPTDESYYDYWYCVEGLTDLAPIEELVALKSLTIIGMQGIDSFAPIASLPILKELTLRDCTVKSLVELAPLKTLTRLSLSNSTIETLDGIEGMKALRHLDLFECAKLESVAPLSHLTKLKEIRLDGCRSLQSLDGLEQYAHAKELSLRRLNSLNDIEVLREFTALKHLDLGHAHALEDTTPLADLSSLESLDLRNCKSLQVVPKRKNMRDRNQVETYLQRL